MIRRTALAAYQFTFDIMIGILVLFLFYIHENELPPIFLLSVMCLGSFICFTLLLLRFSTKGKWIYFASIFPVMIGIGYIADFSIYISAALGLYIFWRGLSLYGDVSEHFETLFLFYSFLIGLVAIIYAAMSHYPYLGLIIYLLIIQIILSLIGGFFTKWWAILDNQSKFGLYFLKMMITTIALGILLTFLLPFFQKVFFSILQFILMLFSNAVEPISRILLYIVSIISNDERTTKLKGGKGSPYDMGKYETSSFHLTADILYVLFFLSAAIFIIHLIYKKIIKLKIGNSKPALLVEVTAGEYLQNQLPIFRQRIKPPENHIRRELFEFERFATKLKLGRLPNETLEEWWRRVGLTQFDRLVTIYESVRYGTIVATPEEELYVKKEIQLLKQQLKEIHKDIKAKK